MSNITPSLFDKGISAYIGEINRFPILTKEKEYMLAKAWRQRQEHEAAQELITSHLRLVVKVALRYQGYGLPVGDLISEGNIGLMTAVKNFDPDKGSRLSTYATYYIKGSIQDYILRSWSLVKISSTAKHKRLFFNLRKLKNSLLEDKSVSKNLGKYAAHKLQVSQKEAENMEQRLLLRDKSLDERLQNGDGSLMDKVADLTIPNSSSSADSQDEVYLFKVLQNSMDEALSRKEKSILTERRMSSNPPTLRELAKKYKISLERVRQIEQEAVKKLQEHMRKKTPELFT